jgi:hypothetical protein
MDRRKQALVLSIAILATAIAPPSASAQAPGFADITQPQPGQVISGLVTIEGSAAHPSFIAYELSFAFDLDPTETWFPIMDAIQTPVTDDRLGIWDTTNITDGDYRLRLRVLLKNGNALEAIVPGLRVRNYTPVEVATAQQPAATPTYSPSVPTSTPRPTPIPIPEYEGSSRVMRAFVIGGIAGVVILLLGGGYVFARQYFRLGWASMRTRRMHRRSDQKRSVGKRDRR